GSTRCSPRSTACCPSPRRFHVEEETTMTQTLDDVLSSMRTLERTLRLADVQAFIDTASPGDRARFIGLRQEVSALVGRLTNAELEGTETQLDALGAELRTGIVRLQARLATLDDMLGLLGTLSMVVGVAARIALMAR